MGFFDRNRKALEAQGIDPSRLPPGQYATARFPVLHVGSVPTYDLSTWSLRVFGAVDRPLELSWNELLARPAAEVTTDIHCVTKWSKFDTVWKGVRLRDLFAEAEIRPEAAHVLFHGENGYAANVALLDASADAALVAYEFDGRPLEPDHGFPARSLVPNLYLWKSTKWLRGIELLERDQPGFWEQNGYHNDADPFREQRFWND